MIPEQNKHARAFFEEYQARHKYKREPKEIGRVSPAHYKILAAVFYAAAIGIVIWALSNVHF